MDYDSAAEIAIVVVKIPKQHAQLLQGLLNGEDGLAAIRCFKPDGSEHELWTSPSMLDELKSWLASLPETLHPVIIDEKRWNAGIRAEIGGGLP